jgi:3-hydroxyacyl-CoA dehydrogenase
MATVETSRQGEIAVITFSNPPVNALSHAVRSGLHEAFAAANADPGCRAIVLTGAGRAFSAGADITEFESGRKEPFLTTLIDAIEASGKPVVAVINGLALGGGLELTLGSHYRVAARSVSQLGLPEVKIGVLPGAGGTQRLPRLVGVEAALDIIVSGAPIGAEKALALGLVDMLADGDVVAAAVDFARTIVTRGEGPRRTGERAIDIARLPPDLFAKRKAALGRHPSGPLAPVRCIECVELATRVPIREGLARESELFRECAASPYARALQYAFFAERRAQSIPDIGPDVRPRAIERVGIVGAGTMGSGIALAFLNAGLPVAIVETEQAALDRGTAHIRSTIEGSVKRGRISAEEAEKRLRQLSASLRLDDLAGADLVIEAVFEAMAVKKQVLGRLDALVRPDAILATNTSTLDVDELAAGTRRPADVVGLHFFSPANIMRLLEIVRGRQTGKDVVATALALAKRIGKVGVVSGVCFGFIGNRMLESYLEEVQAMLLEGASPRDIDAALEGWGLAMGPNAAMDLAGLDVGWRIRQEQRQAGTLREEKARLYRAADSFIEKGRHGQKSGTGFYKYAPGDRKPQPDPEIEALYKVEAARQGIAQRKPGPDEIVERCLIRLANTGASILDEGIALRASDIDTVYLNGYGFPGWRGGPMWQAEHVIGLAAFAERCRAYAARHGDRFKAAPLIERRAKEGKGW